MLNHILTLCPTQPSEQALRARFASIGIVPGEDFDVSALPQQTRQALTAGIHDRYCLSSRDRLQVDADGGLTLVMQASAPQAQSNWLPTPASGAFTLVLRLYGPERQVIEQQWQMPGIEVVSM